MKYLILYIAVVLILSGSFYSPVFGDETYPYSYLLNEFHEGGRLLINPGDSGLNPRTYFIKPNWAEGSETIYTWNGLQRTNAKGSSFGSTEVLAAFPVGNSLLTVIKDKEKIYSTLIDTSLSTSFISEIHGNWSEYSPIDARWIGQTIAGDYALIINSNLYLCKIDPEGHIDNRLLAEGVSQAEVFKNEDSKFSLAYLIKQEASSVIRFIDRDLSDRHAATIPFAEWNYLVATSDTLIALSSQNIHSQTLVQLIDSKGVLTTKWIDAFIDQVRAIRHEDVIKVYSISNKKGNNILSYIKFSKFPDKSEEYETILPTEFVEPIGLYYCNELIIALYRNGIATFGLDGEILSSDFMTLGEYIIDVPQIWMDNQHLVLSSMTGSLILKQEDNIFWLLNRFLENRGKILFPMVLILALIITLQLYRHQKRLLKEILDLPSAGVLIVLDKNGRLERANYMGKELLKISDSVPLLRPFRYYFTDLDLKPVRELIDNSLITRNTVKQKINLNLNSEAKEWFCNIVPIRNITGNFRGIVFTGIDITEELERRRLSNWAQLAHDMQTNLSTIRLNAEQFDNASTEENMSRRKKIIHQVNLLIHRVRDIVTVGRTDSLNMSRENASGICREVRNEFDEIMFPDVEFRLETESFNFYCDKAKIIRALRNVVENGIRALKGAKGLIIIKSTKDQRNAIFSIKDNGIGMDEKTIKKMLKPYFTTSKEYGGSGIGTMIIQQVIEQHGGKIEINSEKGIGTEIILSIPLTSYKRTMN